MELFDLKLSPVIDLRRTSSGCWALNSVQAVFDLASGTAAATQVENHVSSEFSSNKRNCSGTGLTCRQYSGWSTSSDVLSRRRFFALAFKGLITPLCQRGIAEHKMHKGAAGVIYSSWTLCTLFSCCHWPSCLILCALPTSKFIAISSTSL